MIDLKPLKSESSRYQEPLKTVIEMQKDSMVENEFIDLFLSMRKKAREIDAQNKEAE